MVHQFRFEDMKNDSAFEKDGALIEGFPPVFDGFSALFGDVLSGQIQQLGGFDGFGKATEPIDAGDEKVLAAAVF